MSKYVSEREYYRQLHAWQKAVTESFMELGPVLEQMAKTIQQLHERLQELEEYVASESDSPDG